MAAASLRIAICMPGFHQTHRWRLLSSTFMIISLEALFSYPQNSKNKTKKSFPKQPARVFWDSNNLVWKKSHFNQLFHRQPLVTIDRNPWPTSDILRLRSNSQKLGERWSWYHWDNPPTQVLLSPIFLFMAFANTWNSLKCRNSQTSSIREGWRRFFQKGGRVLIFSLPA